MSPGRVSAPWKTKRKSFVLKCIDLLRLQGTWVLFSPLEGFAFSLIIQVDWEADRLVGPGTEVRSALWKDGLTVLSVQCSRKVATEQFVRSRSFLVFRGLPWDPAVKINLPRKSGQTGGRWITLRGLLFSLLDSFLWTDILLWYLQEFESDYVVFKSKTLDFDRRLGTILCEGFFNCNGLEAAFKVGSEEAIIIIIYQWII